MDKVEMQEIDQQIMSKRTLNLQLTLRDVDTNQVATANLSLFSNDQLTLVRELGQCSLRALADIGLVKLKKESDMDDKKEEKLEEQKQDLKHHKTEETDNLVKSERPSDDYMDSHEMDRETHGKKH